MLRLDNITKEYPMKGGDSVKALKGISLCFRSNEFVSILGPSGCGKTTLLNILGGLDHYTSGDLIIEGRSTKSYNDHDWDIYRNHRIGFIFQSYNLIPHENILDNVALALTIGGIGKEERIQRAKEALDEVGLKDMYKKMPNQLSGGQCQRVAIARALVNEPEILLADEPTGALDSVTSVQIMDLIKKISQKKLVIMVTHNPDLAVKYSTRIVKLLDGRLIDDSNPYTAEEEAKERENVTQESVQELEKKEKAKMSWWTAFKLSSKNLLSKMGRTVMVIIAASIGIIGVSAVLSVSNGVTSYIAGSEDEMLSGNPVQVSSSTFDLSSIANQMTGATQAQVVKEASEDGYINVDFMTQRLIEQATSIGTSMIQNDITQDYVDYVDEMPSTYYQDVVKHYGTQVTNNIYTQDNIEGNDPSDSYSLSAITEIASAILSQKLSETGYSSYASTIASYSGTLAQSINNTDYLLEQYDIVDGKVAENEDEIMVVLNDSDAITDFMLTLLGYFSEDEFLNIVYKYNTDENGNPQPAYNDALYQQTKRIAISKLMGKKFTYYPNDTVFADNDKYDPDASAGQASLTPIVTQPYIYKYKEDSSWTGGMQLKVVGVLKPKANRQYSTLSSGFYYTPKFVERFISDNYSSKVTNFIRNYVDSYNNSEDNTSGTTITGYPSYIMDSNGFKTPHGFFYSFHYSLEGKDYDGNYALVGSTNSLTSLLAMYASSSSSSSSSSSPSISTSILTLKGVGGSKLPNSISFYPKNFDQKYLVTDYLTRWNSEDTLTVNGKELKAEDRKEIKYTDNLQVVIDIINNIINIVTIALICFTALALVVSTVMISIITYVSVIERIKEIGVIRALGGRKKDVSHLFNAENFILGFFAGLLGLLVTYLLELILNLIVHHNFPVISMIANLPVTTALIILAASIFLTWLAGFIPSRSAAKKDPVVALRSE